VCVLVGLIALFGGYSVSGLALTGGALLRSAVLWAVTMMLLGLYEELLFRGYPQLTLVTGMGFWPAAVLISALFAGVHYFFKPMEYIADALSVGLIGIFLCLTLRRTGSLWWAIGFHFAFDYAALVVFGAPTTGNDGQRIADHLLASSWHGPAWLTGGPRGAEASCVLPAMPNGSRSGPTGSSTISSTPSRTASTSSPCPSVCDPSSSTTARSSVSSVASPTARSATSCAPPSANRTSSPASSPPSRPSAPWSTGTHTCISSSPTGAFRPDGTFLHLGFHDVDILTEAFRRAVLREFVRRQLLAPDDARSMLA
jgi:hypothetical protein